MDVVKKVEAEGAESGEVAREVEIVDCGVL